MSSRKILYYVETDDEDPSIKYITEQKGHRTKLYTCTKDDFIENSYLLSNEIGEQVLDFLNANFNTYMNNFIENSETNQSDIEDLF